MSNNETANVVVSTPILGILGVLFIALKLTGVIAWSWWWVLAPFWLPLAALLLGVLFLIVFIVFMKGGNR